MNLAKRQRFYSWLLTAGDNLLTFPGAKSIQKQQDTSMVKFRFRPGCIRTEGLKP